MRGSWEILLSLIFLCAVGSAGARADTIYVTNYNGNTISKITNDGVVSDFVGGMGGDRGNLLNTPLGLTVDAGGNFFVTNSSDRRIIKVDPTGNTSVFSTSPNPSQGLAVNKTGDLFIAKVPGSITKITPFHS